MEDVLSEEVAVEEGREGSEVWEVGRWVVWVEVKDERLLLLCGEGECEESVIGSSLDRFGPPLTPPAAGAYICVCWCCCWGSTSLAASLLER